MSNQTYDVGIDLGTTFSVIAVAGQIELNESYGLGEYYEEINVTVIPTPDGNPTFESVYWEPAGEPENALIGSEAKQKAEEGESPIMFSKRNIGTTVELSINGQVYTAKQIATKFLKYFKECAEKALGCEIKRAVITHPAYFDPNQIQETREAAIDAGFDMSLDDQMMMEPVAAALAFTRQEEQDPLKIMTYDLGGGTFDVTVLERSEGVIDMRSFDGNQLLGGYNFDRELVDWIRRKLEEKGRDIPYDDNDSEHRARYCQLMQLAEGVKIKLARQSTSKIPVQVKSPDILVDTDGNKVQIAEKISREEYTALIKDLIEETIDCSRRALEKAGFSVDEIDRVILVGGSTEGPWISEAVEEAFAIAVEPFHPDICVAAGAAIRAAELPPVSRMGGIELSVDVPALSPLPEINVTGILKRYSDEGLSPLGDNDYRLTLRTPDAGTLEREALDAEGRFLFEDIGLAEHGASDFVLEVKDGQGTTVITKTFSVLYSMEEAGVSEILTVLPKPIYLKSASGMRPIAEENQRLPAEAEIELKRLHEDEDSVDVEIYQESVRICTLTIDGIPSDAGAGCKVRFAVEITAKNQMLGQLQILSQSGVVLVERAVAIKFPPIKIPELAELRADFDEIEREREQQLGLPSDAAHRVRLQGKGRKLSAQIEKAFAMQPADRQEIHQKLKEFKNLVVPVSDTMDPPRSDFSNLIGKCQSLIDSNDSNPQISAYREPLRKLEEDGNKAHSEKNNSLWTRTIDGLEQIHEKLKNLVGGKPWVDDRRELPPTTVIKDAFRMKVQELRTNLNRKREELKTDGRYESKFKSRLDRIEQRIDQLEEAIDRVDDGLPPEQGLPQLQMAARGIPGIQKEIDEAGIDTK